MEDSEEDSYSLSSPSISSLLAMAESFLGQSPPKVREAVRCLMAVLTQHPPPRTEAKTRLQLGLTLFYHTNNLLEAREHLDKAALVAQSAANLEDVRFEATSVSARILVEQQTYHQAKSLLRGRLDASVRHPYWHIRLLLQLADIGVSERDEGGVVSALNKAVDYAGQVDAPYTRLLCSLCKGAFLLTHHRYQEAGEVLNHTSGMMEDYHGIKEVLIRTFYLIVQVSHLLVAGQVKAAKPHLKQLQQRVKTLSSEQSLVHFSPVNSLDSKLLAENFQWLTREQTFVMVYLVSVMHSVQGGYTAKALSYAEKAMHFMPAEDSKDSGVASVLRAHLLEQIIQCLLMKGDTASSADKIQEVLGVCHGHSQLVYSHRAVLHTLLGLYAFATENLDRAAIQFHTALQHTNSGELRVFVSLNLALCYMKLGESHNAELAALMKTVESDSATESCQSLRAALHYVKGLYSFIQLKLHEAKRHLRETLLMSNKSDLNRLTTCSLILLGQIFLSIGNTKETMDMVSPAVQLSSKIPDKKLQVWAATLLADLYHLTGDQEKEFTLRQQSSSIEGEIQSDLSAALKSKHHGLIQWTVGEWPVVQQPKQPPSALPNAQQHTPFINTSSTSFSSNSSPSLSSPLHSKKKRKRGLDESLEHGGSKGQESPMPVLQDRKLSREADGPQTPLKDLTIKLQHDSPVWNSTHKSGNSSPLATASPTHRGSPVTMRTPELKLKKVTTPTSSRMSSIFGAQNESPLQKESDHLNEFEESKPLSNSITESRMDTAEPFEARKAVSQGTSTPSGSPLLNSDPLIRGNPVAPATQHAHSTQPPLKANSHENSPLLSSHPPSFSPQTNLRSYPATQVDQQLQHHQKQPQQQQKSQQEQQQQQQQQQQQKQQQQLLQQPKQQQPMHQHLQQRTSANVQRQSPYRQSRIESSIAEDMQRMLEQHPANSPTPSKSPLDMMLTQHPIGGSVEMPSSSRSPGGDTLTGMHNQRHPSPVHSQAFPPQQNHVRLKSLQAASHSISPHSALSTSHSGSPHSSLTTPLSTPHSGLTASHTPSSAPHSASPHTAFSTTHSAAFSAPHSVSPHTGLGAPHSSPHTAFSAPHSGSLHTASLLSTSHSGSPHSTLGGPHYESPLPLQQQQQPQQRLLQQPLTPSKTGLQSQAMDMLHSFQKQEQPQLKNVSPSGSLYLNSPQAVSNDASQYQQLYLRQKQLAEEERKQQQQKLLNSQQQQQVDVLGRQQHSLGNLFPQQQLNSSPQKYFHGVQGGVEQHSQDVLQQQQQQQQQLLRQQVQMQRQYLLQQAATGGVGAVQPPFLQQSQQPLASSYRALNPVGLESPNKPLQPQMPHLTHMMARHRVPVDQTARLVSEQASPSRAQRPVMVPINHHQPLTPLGGQPAATVGHGAGSYGQSGGQLLPNGASSLTGQQNPTYSPLMHYHPR